MPADRAAARGGGPGPGLTPQAAEVGAGHSVYAPPMRSPAQLLVAFALSAACSGPPPVTLPPADLAQPVTDLAAADDQGQTGEVPRESGSIITLIESEGATTIAAQHQGPTSAEQKAFRQALTLLLSGEGERAVPLLTPLGYGVTDFTDTTLAARAKRFYVVRERQGVRRYQGLYLLRRDIDLTQKTGRVMLEVPYGNDASVQYLKHQAARALLHADAGGLLLNTVDRCAAATTPGSCTLCVNATAQQGCVRCGGVERTYYPATDQGRSDKGLFQVAHEVLTAGDRVAIFVGGMLTTGTLFTGKVTLVSDGTRRPPAVGAAATLQKALLGAVEAELVDQSVRLCGAADATGAAAPLDLCGETLVQGRQSNLNLMMGGSLCTATPASAGSGRYLVLNQTYEVRRTDGTARTDLPNMLGQALIDTFGQ